MNNEDYFTEKRILGRVEVSEPERQRIEEIAEHLQAKVLDKDTWLVTCPWCSSPSNAKQTIMFRHSGVINCRPCKRMESPVVLCKIDQPEFDKDSDNIKSFVAREFTEELPDMIQMPDELSSFRIGLLHKGFEPFLTTRLVWLDDNDLLGLVLYQGKGSLNWEKARVDQGRYLSREAFLNQANALQEDEVDVVPDPWCAIAHKIEHKRHALIPVDQFPKFDHIDSMSDANRKAFKERRIFIHYRSLEEKSWAKRMAERMRGVYSPNVAIKEVDYSSIRRASVSRSKSVLPFKIGGTMAKPGNVKLTIHEREDGIVCPDLGTTLGFPEGTLQRIWNILGYDVQTRQREKFRLLATELAAEGEEVSLDKIDEYLRNLRAVGEDLQLTAYRNELNSVLEAEKVYAANDSTGEKNMDIYKYAPDKGIYVLCPQSYLNSLVLNLALKIWRGVKLSTIGAEMRPAKAYLLSQLEKRRRTFNETTGKIVLKNGILDVRRGKVEPFSEGHFSTIAVSTDFDPGADAPKWRAFLEFALPNPLDQIELGKVFYRVLLGDISDQRIIFLVGEPATGKSTILSVLSELVGSDAVTRILAKDLMEVRFSLAELNGKLLNISGETPENIRLDDTFKNLTEPEIMAPRKFKSDLKFKNRCRMIFASNNIPHLRDLSTGVERRMLTILFKNTIPIDQRRPTFLQELLEELPGILNWSLSHQTIWENDNGFRQELQQAFLAEVRKVSDSVTAFVMDVIFPTTEMEIDFQQRKAADRASVLMSAMQSAQFGLDAPGIAAEPLLSKDQRVPFPYINVTRLYKAYRTHCEENSNSPVSASTFSGRLRSFFISQGIQEKFVMVHQRVTFGGLKCTCLNFQAK